ncbi:MAG: hypothetical protein ACRDGQ_13995, partial [Candidatus Limnocylindrales bacterium]
MAGRRPTDRDFRLARLARERYGLADLTLEPDPGTARTIAARLAAGVGERGSANDSGRPGGPGPNDQREPPDAGTTRRPMPTDPARSADQSELANLPAPEVQPGPADHLVSTQPVSAGALQAAGTLVAILGRVIDQFRDATESGALRVAADEVAELGPVGLDASVAAFPLEFPLRLEQPEAPDPDGALAQLVLLGILSENPAIAPFEELIDLRPLGRRAAGAGSIRAGAARAAATHAAASRAALATPRPDGSMALDDPIQLIELLREPARAAPDSLAGQLRYIRSAWTERFGPLLDDLFERLLIALDVLAEEERAAQLAWQGSQPDAGMGGPAEVYTFGDQDSELEQFSQDTDWMPRLVLVAKSSHVWLDQLSQRYGREIRTLDAIPDEELARLAARGMTGLWL